MPDGSVTYHLAPRGRWEAADPSLPYEAPSFAEEGFTHCTDGASRLRETADRHFRADPRDFVVLVLDLGRIRAPWRYDDGARVYPHIYGPIDRDAVLAVVTASRDASGGFLAMAALGEGQTRSGG